MTTRTKPKAKQVESATIQIELPRGSGKLGASVLAEEAKRVTRAFCFGTVNT